MSSLTSAAVPSPVVRPPMRFSRLGDELLARHAARGSERAFAALYERYHQQLYRYCRSILRDDSDAQDALQSTFAGALQALRRNQRSAPLRPWLYRIAHNESVSLLRRRGRESRDGLDADSLGTAASVDQEATDRARWRSLMDDLGHLPDRQRGALLLRELSGLSHEEIAIAFGTTTAAAKQAIFEARQALVELEQGRAMNCEDVRRQVSEGDRRVLRGRRIGAHLRECSACEAFVLAIPARRAQLLALTPVLPPATAAALLTRSLHAASAQGGASATSAAATAGVAGKAAGTALAWKALAGAAVIVTTAAGVGGVSHLLAHHTAARVAPAPRTGHPATVHQASVVTKSRGPATAASSTRRHAAQDPGTFHARRARPSSGHHTSTAALRAATPSDSTTTASNSASPAASASVGGSGSHAGGAHGYQAGGSWHSPSWSAGGGDHTNGWDHGEHGAGHPAYGLTATGQATTAVGQATTAVGKATTAAGQAAAGAGHAAAGAGQAIQGGGVSSRSGWATSQGGGATSQGVITSQDHGPVNQGPQHRTSPPKL